MYLYSDLFLLLAWCATVLTALLIGAGIHAAYQAILDRRARSRLRRKLDNLPPLLKRQAE